MADPNRPEKPAIRALRTIRQDKYSSDFVKNMQELNSSTEFMAKMLIVMQGGIDDANASILDQIQGAIDELIIIFTGEGIGDLFDFGALEQLFGQNGGILGQIGKGIGDFINALISLLPFGIGQGLTGLADTLNNTHETAEGAIEQVYIVEQQVGNKLSYFDVRSNVPLWQSIHPIGFQSIPRAMLRMDYSGSGSDSHTHGNNGSGSASVSINLAKVDPGFSFATGVAYGAAIRCEGNMSLGLVQFYAKGTATDLRVVLHKMAANGTTTVIEAASPNLAGLIFNARHSEIQWILEDSIAVEAGDVVIPFVYANDTIALAGIDIFDPLPMPGFYPQKIGCSAASSAVGSGLATSAVSYQGNTPFFSIEPEVGQAVVKRQVYDTFNRPNTTSFPDYNHSTSVSGEPEIVNNELRWNSGSDGRAILTFLQPLASDTIDGQFVVGTWGGTNTGAITRMVVMGTGSATKGLSIAAVPGTGYRLEYTTAVDTYVTIDTSTLGGTPQPSDLIQFFIAGDFVKVFRQGNLIFDTTVSASLVPRGPGNRYVSVSVRRNAGAINGTNNSPHLDSFFAQDTPDPEPEP